MAEKKAAKKAATAMADLASTGPSEAEVKAAAEGVVTLAKAASKKKPAAKKPVVKVIAAAKEPEPVVVARVAVYRDGLGEWRWKALARNNKIVADSAEGYNNKMYAIKVARALHPGVPVELHS